MSTLEVDKIIPQSGTDTQLGESGDTITIPAGATITNSGTANGFGSADTEKVKVSANDTTAGFLNGKLVAGTNISLTEGSDGGDETLTAAFSGNLNASVINAGTIATARLGSGTASSSTFLRGDQTYATPAGGTNTPAFEATRSSNQTISNDTVTKIACNVETFDIGSGYDNSSNYRFTPQTAGKYYVYANATAYLDVEQLKRFSLFIQKNGSNYKGSAKYFNGNPARIIATYMGAVIDFNGSSDYVELFTKIEYVSSSTILIPGSSTELTFGAYKIIT